MRRLTDSDFWWGFTHPGEATRWLVGDARNWVVNQYEQRTTRVRNCVVVG